MASGCHARRMWKRGRDFCAALHLRLQTLYDSREWLRWVLERTKTCPPQERAAPTKSTPPNEDDHVVASPSRILRGGEGRFLFKLSTTPIPQGASRPAARMLGYSANAHRRKIAIDDGDRNCPYCAAFGA